MSVCIVLVSPLCYMRQTNASKYTSMISITSVIILTIIITMHTIQIFARREYKIYYIDNNGYSQSSMIDSITSTINLWPEKF